MRILVTGASGMLGSAVCDALRRSSTADFTVTALTRDDLDIGDDIAVREAVSKHDVIVNTAAYTKVDDAETHEDLAYRVNALGPQNLALAAREAGSRLIHLSTDYVFDGRASDPYSEDSPRHPLSAYGRSKASGEELVLAEYPAGTAIVRTAWLYGNNGSNFVDTMLRLAGERETLEVVDDQRGQPTWANDLAIRIAEIIERGVPAGIFHGTSSGETTWFGLARKIFQLRGLDPDRVKPTSSSQVVRPAARPSYSVLGHDAWGTIGLSPMRPWEDALSERLRQEPKHEREG